MNLVRICSFSIVYFEGRHQTKRWLISQQDVEKMYEKLQGKPEIFYGVMAKTIVKQSQKVIMRMHPIIAKGH